MKIAVKKKINWSDKDQVREYDLNYRKRNKVRRRTKQEFRELEIKEKWLELRLTLKCERCGESDARVLEFHHKVSEEKVAVSSLVADGASWERILKEVKKCSVLCANCHRKRHVRIVEVKRGDRVFKILRHHN